jgi:hypothetical protein
MPVRSVRVAAAGAVNAVRVRIDGGTLTSGQSRCGSCDERSYASSRSTADRSRQLQNRLGSKVCASRGCPAFDRAICHSGRDRRCSTSTRSGGLAPGLGYTYRVGKPERRTARWTGLAFYLGMFKIQPCPRRAEPLPALDRIRRRLNSFARNAPSRLTIARR